METIQTHEIQQASPTRWIGRAALAAFFIFSAGYFALRGPMAKTSELSDFGIIYIAADTWRIGQNPYDQQLLVSRWAEMTHNAPRWLERDVSWLPSVVPPTTLAIVSPLTLVAPVPAAIVYVGLLYVAVLAVIVAALRIVDLPLWDWRASLLAACVMASGPVHSGMNCGQPAIFAAALVLLGLWAWRRNRAILAGVLLVLATMLKLQLGAPFIAYMFWRRQWRAGFTASAIFAVVGLSSLLWMQAHDFDWHQPWMRNIEITARVGGLNDFDPANEGRAQLLNVHLLLATLMEDRRLIQILAPAVAAAIGIPLMFATWGKLSRGAELAAVAAFSALILLPVYHRFYDSAILALPFAWCLAHLKDDLRRIAWLGLLALFPFVLPVAWAVQVVHRGQVPVDVTRSALWQHIVVPHLVLALMGLSIALIWATWKARQRAPVSSL